MSQRGKEGAGASGNVETDGANPSQVLPTQVEMVNNETGLPVDLLIPTEVRVDNVDDQQELEHKEEAESSNAGKWVDPNNVATDVRTNQVNEVAEPSMKDVLEAMKLMGAQLVTLTQAFTPLVNSSVGQVTPPVRVAARAAGERARPVAEVVEIDPPARPAHRVE
ncbi:hypothetical protein Bca52824_017741 [Brassica carinata]|uniref:Uncharacterized protein n=1 Tax=Brassica carinata TaxID=52824 RepID=A0A8X8AVP6_BRACI|nr:hypothetical protein Bca52824_017741 [Brassica carinata]